LIEETDFLRNTGTGNNFASRSLVERNDKAAAAQRSIYCPLELMLSFRILDTVVNLNFPLIFSSYIVSISVLVVT